MRGFVGVIYRGYSGYIGFRGFPKLGGILKRFCRGYIRVIVIIYGLGISQDQGYLFLEELTYPLCTYVLNARQLVLYPSYTDSACLF